MRSGIHFQGYTPKLSAYDYSSRIVNYASKSLLGLVGSFDTSSEVKCKQILSDRYDDIVGKVQQHIDTLIP